MGTSSCTLSTSDGTALPHATTIFAGGEVQVRLSRETIARRPSAIEMRADIRNSRDLMEMVLLADAAHQAFGHQVDIALTIPYLPYARQDRVCAPGEALSLCAIARLIASCSFNHVTTWDVHSAVASELLPGLSNIEAETFVARIPEASRPTTILVAPDKGARERVAGCASLLGQPMVFGTKHRDPDTGAITATTLSGEVLGADALMIDDICDGGRTFTALAQHLRDAGAQKVWLYVTHGIFSQGLGVFDGVVDHIWTANPWPGFETDPRLTVIPH